MNIIYDKPLSFSSLSRFIHDGWEGFMNPTYKNSIYFEKGTIIDKLVFNQKITEEIVDIKTPRPQIKKLIESLVDSGEKFTGEIIKKHCTEIQIKSKNYLKLVKELNNHKDYIAYYKNNKYKFLKSNYDIAKEISDSILENEMMMNYLSGGEAQLELNFEYKGFKFRAILDYLIIDDKNKEVTIVDLKSTSYPPNFFNSIEKYLYYLQGYIYILAVEDYLKKIGKENYQINPFVWAVTSSVKPNIHTIEVMHYKQEIKASDLLVETLEKLKYAIENEGEELREQEYII